MKPVTALVTGVGAALGISIIKALRASGLPVRVVGVDSESLAQGLFRVDRAHLIPSAREDANKYFEALVNVSRAENAQILFSGWEGELLLLADRKAEFEERTGAVLPLAPAATKAALDKWLTIKILSAAGVPVPDTVLPNDQEQLEAFRRKHAYPYLMKRRRGWGGQGLVLVHTDEELAFFSRYIPDPVIQEYLLPADREYTVGVFLLGDGKPAGVLALKRTMASGLSYRMESNQNPDVCKVAAQASVALGLIGPVNVQMRLTPAGAKVFEVNPRCSSATCVRARFGLNEPEMAIRRFVLGEDLPPPTVHEGICLRFWEEIYLPIEVKTAAQQGHYLCQGQIGGEF